jgi:hypothetical protein
MRLSTRKNEALLSKQFAARCREGYRDDFGVTTYPEFFPSDPRLSISFITISLFASITTRNRGICSPVSVG